MAPAANKKLRKKWSGKVARGKVEVSRAIRAIPFNLARWKEFARTIERTGDEMALLESETRKLEARNTPAAQLRVKELKRDLKKKELEAGASCRICGIAFPLYGTARLKRSAPRKIWWKPICAWWFPWPRSTSTVDCICWI